MGFVTADLWQWCVRIQSQGLLSYYHRSPQVTFQHLPSGGLKARIRAIKFVWRRALTYPDRGGWVSSGSPFKAA